MFHQTVELRLSVKQMYVFHHLRDKTNSVKIQIKKLFFNFKNKHF